jgi:hypothetical protein
MNGKVDCAIARALEVRIAVLEQQHSTFERSAVDHMARAANEESTIHERLDELVSEVHKIPEMVSTKINESRSQLREEIDKDHPRRHEVVTPRALMLAASLLGVMLVAGMTATMVVWDKIDQTSQAPIRIEQSYDAPEHK